MSFADDKLVKDEQSLVPGVPSGLTFPVPAQVPPVPTASAGSAAIPGPIVRLRTFTTAAVVDAAVSAAMAVSVDMAIMPIRMTTAATAVTATNPVSNGSSPDSQLVLRRFPSHEHATSPADAERSAMPRIASIVLGAAPPSSRVQLGFLSIAVCVFLSGFIALGLNTARLLCVRAELNAACEAAALAGAAELMGEDEILGKPENRDDILMAREAARLAGFAQLRRWP